MSTRALRTLFVAVAAVVFVDTMFYAVVAPLLPSLVRQLHLSKVSAGVLTAAYPLGTLIGSLPGGVLAERVGPRPTVYVGLGLLAGSSVAFGFLHSIAPLDLARFAQGIGGACSWAGGLAWLVAEVPAERRGAAIGGSLSAAIGGSLFGPVLGTVAQAVSRAAVFSAVVLVAGGLSLWISRLPPPSPTEADQGLRALRGALWRRPVLLAMWLVLVPAIASGAVNVLGPLRLSRLGAVTGAIGATYVVAAGAEALTSAFAGRISDRRGRILPVRVGLAVAALLAICFTLPATPLLLAAWIVAIVIGLGAFWAPAMAMLADAASDYGVGQGYALALVNLAWALGQIIGSGGGGALAKAAGDLAPFACVSAMCAVTLVLVTASGWVSRSAT